MPVGRGTAGAYGESEEDTARGLVTVNIEDWRASIEKELARPEIVTLSQHVRQWEKKDHPGRIGVSIALDTLERVAYGRLELLDAPPDQSTAEYKSVSGVKALVKKLRLEAGIS